MQPPYICEIPGTPKDVGPPFPYYSHKNPLKYGNGMGSLWGVSPTIGGVPEEIPK